MSTTAEQAGANEVTQIEGGRPVARRASKLGALVPALLLAPAILFTTIFSAGWFTTLRTRSHSEDILYADPAWAPEGFYGYAVLLGHTLTTAVTVYALARAISLLSGLVWPGCVVGVLLSFPVAIFAIYPYYVLPPSAVIFNVAVTLWVYLPFRRRLQPHVSVG